MINSRLFSAVSKQQVLLSVINCSTLNVTSTDSVQRTIFPGGIRIAAGKRQGAPLVGVTVMFDAGTRHEGDDSLGVNHFLRRLSDANTEKHTSFCKTRVLQQHGAYVTCSSDRQYISYTMRCPEPVFHEHKDLFLESAVNPGAYLWDIEPRKSIVKHDTLTLSPKQRLFDLIQTASWTHGLSNSLYCHVGRAKSMSDCVVQNYVKSHYTSENCTVGTVGLDYKDVVKFVETMFPMPPVPRSSKCDDEPSPSSDSSCFRGGFEYYDLGPGATSYFAIAVPSSGLNTLHEFLKYNIAVWACGGDMMCTSKSGTNNVYQAPLSQLSAGDIHTSLSAFNISYKNCGLFGIMGKTKSDLLCTMALEAAKFLKTINSLDSSQIAVGKARLQTTFARSDYDSALKSEDFALQAANNIIIDSSDDAVECISAIPPEQVACTLQNIAHYSNQFALAVVGDIGCMPTTVDLRSWIG